MTRIFKFLAIALLATAAVSGTTNTAHAAEPATVQSTDLVVGTGELVQLGQRVKVHYTGWLLDGTQFDSSRGTSPFKFTLGAREVIRGWDLGVQGMRVGGKRELIIPPELAYGKRGFPGAIPPNSTLKFEVELVEVNANKGRAH